MTDKEKFRAEIERLRGSFKVLSVTSPSRDTTLEYIAKAALCKQILFFIDSMQEEPVSEDLEKAAEEWDGSLYRSDAFKAGAKWLSNIICSEIEKRLQYMQYAPHRANTYKELKSLLAYIKSYV